MLKKKLSYYLVNGGGGSCTRANTHRVQHLQNFVLFTGIQAIDDDGHTGLVLGETIDGFGHF